MALRARRGNVGLAFCSGKKAFDPKQLIMQHKSKEIANSPEKTSNEKIKPMIISKEEYRYIFGDSSDEEQEFYGFEDHELGLKEFKSVVSPNKLKLQNDFYLPLSLSQRKRKRGNYDSFEYEEADQTKRVDVVTPKSEVQGSFKSSSSATKGEYTSEVFNPYAKQYRSYRKNRSRSYPENDMGEGVNRRLMQDPQETAPIENEPSQSPKKCFDEDKKESDLKMKIQYRTSSRPKRTVTVAEKKDFVYDVSFPSSKKQRHVSPTITSAKIVQDDQADKGLEDLNDSLENKFPAKQGSEKEEYNGKAKSNSSAAEQEDSIARAKKEFDDCFKNKRKKRFKNIQNADIGYPRALLTDIMLSDTGKPIKHSSLKSDQSPCAESHAVHNEVQLESNALLKDLASLKSEEAAIIATNDESRKITEELGSVKLFENNQSKDDRESLTPSSVIINEEKDRDMHDSSKSKKEHEDIISDHVFEEPTANHSKRQKVLMVEKESDKNLRTSHQLFDSKHDKTEILSRRKMCTDESRKQPVSKAKTISLTDSWFSTAVASGKKKSKLSKSRQASSNEVSKKGFSKPNENMNSGNPPISLFEKFELQLKNRPSTLSKKRRLKNVSFHENANADTINENEDGLGRKGVAKERGAAGKSCEYESQLVSSDANSSREWSHHRDKGKANSVMPEASVIETKRQSGSRRRSQHSRDSLDTAVYNDCPLTAVVDKSDLNAVKQLRRARLQGDTSRPKCRDNNESSNISDVQKESSSVENNDYQDLSQLENRRGLYLEKQNRFSRKKLSTVSHDEQRMSEITFAKPMQIITPDVQERNLDFLNASETQSSLDSTKEGKQEAELNSQQENPTDSEKERKEKKSSRSLIKGDIKCNKSDGPGRSFIIKTAVDAESKQVAEMKEHSDKLRTLKSPKSISSKIRNSDQYDSEEENEFVKLSNNGIGMQRKTTDMNQSKKVIVPSGKGNLDEKKIRRKVYTVVRKIRRTEVNAEGKKVTKIIKQVVKKVCPVNDDDDDVVLKNQAQPDSNRDGRIDFMKNKIFETFKDGKVDGSVIDGKVDMTKSKMFERVKDGKVDITKSKLFENMKAKVLKPERCGECSGCLLLNDCENCANCRKNKQNVTGNSKALVCMKRKCLALRNAENRKLSKDSKEAQKTSSKAVKQRSKKNQQAPKSENDPKDEETPKKEPPTAQASVKAKPKSKGVKAAIKDAKLEDIVYSPGFKLRSKVNDTVKVAPGRILKQVQYSGLEPTVKLPWPEEQGESAVSDSGYFCCLTSPIAIKAKDICYHCGSGGFLKMIYCIECSEAYHDFCIDIDPLDENNWLCDRCKRCKVCGFKDNLLMCDHCHDCYHVECLGPNYHKKTEGDDELWVCAKCVKCTKCGKKTPGKRKESKWMNNFTMCEECDRRVRRGQYCIVCEKVYSEHDYETKMMYCTACKKWIHMECEGLSIDEYECLAELPDHIPYICKTCHDKETWPTWYQEVREEINAGFEKIYYDFLASSDYKIIKKHVGEVEIDFVNQSLEEIFTQIQQNKFSTVVEFLAAFETYLDKLDVLISDKLPNIIIKDVRQSIYKQTQTLFPWIEKDEGVEKPKAWPKLGTEVPDYAVPTITLDHTYHSDKSEKKIELSEKLENKPSVTNKKDDTTDSDVIEDSSQPSINGNIFDKLMCLEPTLKDARGIERKQSCPETKPTVASHSKQEGQTGIDAVVKDNRGKSMVSEQVKEGKEATEKKEAIEVKDTIEDKETIEAKEATRVKETTEIKETIEAKEVLDLKDAKEANEAKEATNTKEINEENDCTEAKNASKAKDATEVTKGTVVKDGTTVPVDNQSSDVAKEDSSKMECVPSVQSDVGDSDSVVDSKGDSVDDENFNEEDSAAMEPNIRAAKHNDDRRCMLCSQYGDEPQNEAGRILSAGLGEWVHVNCALWSAEVFENESGLLQNVHTAVVRGQKLRCSVCQQWGATVGCCAANCPSNFHFMCARNKNINFQDNKIVYCERHKSKSKNQVLLSDDGFAVLRPVMVGMSKVLSQKKFCIAKDPNAVHVYSGSLTVNRLGRLSESSDDSMTLLPIGFRATRVFWDARDSRRRCKYYFSIEEKQNVVKQPDEDLDIITGGSTISHGLLSPKRKQRRVLSDSDCSLPNKRIRMDNDDVITDNRIKPVQTSSSILSPVEQKFPAIDTSSSSITESAQQTSRPTTANAGNDRKFQRSGLFSSVRKPIVSPVKSHQTSSLNPNELSAAVSAVMRNPIPEAVFSSTAPKTQHTPIIQQRLPSARTSPRVMTPQGVDDSSNIFHQNTSQASFCELEPNAPRLIQPNVQFQTHNDIFNFQNDSSSSPCKPTLSKRGYSTKLLDQLQSYIEKNPEMFNYVGNTSIQDLKQSTTRPSSLADSRDSQSRVPCYSLSVPEEYLKSLVPKVYQDLKEAERNSPHKASTSKQTHDNFRHHSRVITAEDFDGSNPFGSPDRKYVVLANEAPSKARFMSTHSSTSQPGLTKSFNPPDVIFSHANTKDFTLPHISRLVDELPQCSRNVHNQNDHLSTSFNQERIDFSVSKHRSDTTDSFQSMKVKSMLLKRTSSQTSLASKDGPGESKKNKQWYLDRLKSIENSKIKKKPSSLSIVVKNEDGFRIEGDTLEDVWKQLLDILNETRVDQKLPPLLFNEQDVFDFFGLSKFPLVYLAEQLPGGQKCRNYKFQYHLPCSVDEDKELPLNPHGCARAELYTRHSQNDMFSWLASPYRTLPRSPDEPENESEIKSASDLPLSMRFRQLKSSVKDHVGVYQSPIDRRGLFCKRKIEASEMVIEYAGSVIRGTLTDKREKYYDGKGYGCYMFRIDDTNVVDATLFGNEARFINHSCEPNCYSRIVPVDGKKHIVIFASRSIFPGEELTYDYKFPFEEEKLPCHCGSKRCRKYLN